MCITECVKRYDKQCLIHVALHILKLFYLKNKQLIKLIQMCLIFIFILF